MRPVRPRLRPRPITVRPRPKKWSRDHSGLETLTSLLRTVLISLTPFNCDRGIGKREVKLQSEPGARFLKKSYDKLRKNLG